MDRQLQDDPVRNGLGGTEARSRRRPAWPEQSTTQVAALVAELAAFDVDGAPMPALSAVSIACAATQSRIAMRMAAAAPEQGGTTTGQPETFISVKEAAVRLAVGPQWIYRRQAHLPFLRRIGARGLRASARALDRYLANRRPL
jgi:hypothetical protein